MRNAIVLRRGVVEGGVIAIVIGAVAAAARWTRRARREESATRTFDTRSELKAKADVLSVDADLAGWAAAVRHEAASGECGPMLGKEELIARRTASPVT